MHRRTTIIAEAGVNHNGDRGRALSLVEAAARVGADIVKFQSFRADKLATALAAKASYQQVTTGTGQSQLEMLRALELSEDDERRIAEACAAANITYMSTPFDADSATHLVRNIGVSTLKATSSRCGTGRASAPKRWAWVESPRRRPKRSSTPKW